MSSPPHVIRLADLDDEALEAVLQASARLASGAQTGAMELSGKTVGLLFFRRSLRTRASFEVAVHQLGGQAINLTGMSDLWELEAREGVTMDGRAPEHVRDAAAVLSSYVNALAIRPGLVGHRWSVDRLDEQIRTWARYATVPVINMESALWHPLQGLADLLTMQQVLGDPAGKRLAITWVHSPKPVPATVVHSLLNAALRAGMSVRVAHPRGYELDDEVLEEASRLGGEVDTTYDVGEGVQDAHVVYARSWQSLESYGNPTLDASQRARHTNWRVDDALLARCPEAYVMHAMPVRRNVEITDAVIDGPRSLLYRQAENRLHVQKALLARLLT